MANSNGVESQIVDYIIQAQKHGLSDTEIKQNLLNAGWEGSTVEANFVFAKASENKPQAIGSRPQVAPQEGKIIPDTSAKPKIEPQPQPQAQPVEGKIIPDKKPAPAQQQTAQAMPAPTQPSVSSTTESAAPIALPAPHSHKKLALGALVFLLLACAGGAYAYYEYYYNRIEGVWKRLQTAAPEAAKIYKTKYEFSYEFTYKDDFDDPSEKEKPGGLGLSGELYKDFTVENEPKLSNELNVSLKSDSESFNFGISFMFLNKIFYLDLGRVQFLKSILPGQDLGWIKLDPESLMKYLEEKGIPVDDYKQFSEQVSPNSTDSLIFQKLVKVGVIQSGDFLAKEDLNDIAVYHFKNSFDKAAFLPLFFEAINKKMAESNSEIKSLNTEQRKVLTALINKIQIKEFETWVDQKSFQVYKIHLLLSAPSVSDFVNSDSFGPLSSAEAKSRDAARLSTVREYSNALEAYYQDKKGYPSSSEGMPEGLIPNYLDSWVEAPMPADGTCTDYYNPYWYEPAGEPTEIEGVMVYPSYELTFCLGQSTGGYSAGIAKITPQGIEDNIPCPAEINDCINQTPPEAFDPVAIINKWKFDAEMKLDVSFKDFGKTENLVAPSDAKDLIDILKDVLGDEVQKNDDEQRLSDVRQLDGALESYFNDNGSYPESLNVLTPDYIGFIPTPPSVVSGTCSAQDNLYTYTYISPTEYTLTFCLGNPTGDYAAGKHTSSPSGIH